MESTQGSSMISDLRQSVPWAKYLESLGWKNKRLSSEVSIAYTKTPIGTMIKIQKPHDLSKEVLKEIDDFCKSINALFIKVEPNVDQDMNVLEDAGYMRSMIPLTPTATIYMDLTLSEQKLWDNISHSGKYSINRAKRESTVTEYFRNPSIDIVERFYKILKFTGGMKKFYVPPINQVISQVAAFGENAFIIFVKDSNGNDAGAKFYVSDGDMVLYVSGGTTDNGRGNKAGYALMWDSILYFKNLGYKVLDLEGTSDNRFPEFSKRWGGFTEFKEKFSGTPVLFPYPHVKYLNPVFQFLAKYTPLKL